MYTQKHTKHTQRRIRQNFAIVFTQKTLPSVLAVPISFDYVRMKKMSNKKKNPLLIKLLIKSEHVNNVNINKNRPDKINHSANKNRNKT